MADKTTLQDENVKPKTKRTVPAADIDFGKVAKDVAQAWTANPVITLVWTTSGVFAADALAYNTELSERLQMGGSRPQISQALTKLDNQMDDGLAYVKGYILEKYKKDAAHSYYAAFGIEYKGNRYAFPTDRNNRLAALELMKTGLVAHGFDGKEYGAAFWTPIQTQYADLLSKATTTDGSVSTKVSTKNTLKSTLKKTMNSLISVIKGNYPDTYKAELRAWGFQKEKY